MAKIVLVSRHVNPTSWQLAIALKAQQHEVILLTSYDEVPPQNTVGIELMGYFRKWNLFEGLRLLPTLFALQPQIVHILLDDDKMSPAQILLSTFAKSHPQCVLTTSLLNISKGLSRRNPVRYLVEESDIVTCPTVETLGQLRGLNVRSSRQGRGILPPVLQLTKDTPEEIIVDDVEAHLLDFIKQSDFIILPFQESSFSPEKLTFKNIQILAQKYRLVLWGSYAHWTLRDRKKFAAWMKETQVAANWIVTGPISTLLASHLLQKTQALMLAGQSFSPIEMTEYYMQAIHAKSALILDSAQTSVHADLWKNNVNCWVLNSEQIQKDLTELVAKHDLQLPECLSEKLAQERHLIDSSLNELNRLYNRALTHLK